MVITAQFGTFLPQLVCSYGTMQTQTGSAAACTFTKERIMKTTLSVLAICLTAACGGSGGSMSSEPSFDVATPASVMADAGHVSSNQLFAGSSMLNGVRSDAGSNPVTYDARLGAAAQTHANDMLANDFFSHTGSDGSSVGDRVTAQGYNWRTVGENIARGQADEAAVLAAWVNSPGHQSNNVNPNFEDFALAKAGTGSNQYWVLVLAAEQ
jgi:uncharacterized protein YkwD